MASGRHALRLTDDQHSFFQAEAGSDVRLDVPMAAVVRNAHDVCWLWKDRIPLGRVTLIEGAARSGKSFVALDLAARLSDRQPWPDSDGPDLIIGDSRVSDGEETVSESAAGPPVPTCLVISLQDSPGDTLGRRLQLAGGNPNRVLHFSQFFTTDSQQREAFRSARFPDDLPAVEHLLDKYNDPPLVVIDPLSDFCRTPGAMAETIHALNDLANDRCVAIVATLRATGQFDERGRLKVKSRWPTEAARCTWFVAVDPDDDSRRLFVPTRTNFCVEPMGLGFSIESGRVAWDTTTRVDFQDPLQNQSSCALWLAQLLAEGAVHAKVVYRLGGECGYTPAMLRYAGKKIGVSKQRIGCRDDGHWEWSLRPGNLNLGNLKLGNLSPGNLSLGNPIVAILEAASPPGEGSIQLLEHGEIETGEIGTGEITSGAI